MGQAFHNRLKHNHILKYSSTSTNKNIKGNKNAYKAQMKALENMLKHKHYAFVQVMLLLVNNT